MKALPLALLLLALSVSCTTHAAPVPSHSLPRPNPSRDALVGENCSTYDTSADVAGLHAVGAHLQINGGWPEGVYYWLNLVHAYPSDPADRLGTYSVQSHQVADGDFITGKDHGSVRRITTGYMWGESKLFVNEWFFRELGVGPTWAEVACDLAYRYSRLPLPLISDR